MIYDQAKPSETFYNGEINIIGFEFDGTACFRKGTVDGPDALRSISDGIESYSPYLDKDLSELTFYDCGNLKGSGWEEKSNHFYELAKEVNLAQTKILTLGGEHSISYAPIKSYLETYSDLVLVHLDAHADLRDGYEGHHFSHASIIRRTLDHFETNHKLIQYGIRSGTKEEYEWMRSHQTICTSRAAFMEQIDSIPDDRPIYLTLDLDYFDPSFLPGTGTPEPGGEDFHSFIQLVKKLKEKRLVGADVVELSPSIDPTGNSDVFAAKVVREVLLAF